jgi:hypothetical protein
MVAEAMAEEKGAAATAVVLEVAMAAAVMVVVESNRLPVPAGVVVVERATCHGQATG